MLEVSGRIGHLLSQDSSVPIFITVVDITRLSRHFFPWAKFQSARKVSHAGSCIFGKVLIVVPPMTSL